MLDDSRRIILEQLLNRPIESGLTNKVSALVSRNNQMWEAHAGDSNSDTIYDLASLTKILCTTYLVSKAVSEKKLDLEEKPWVNWPGVNIKNILLHNSGLPAWREISTIQEDLNIKLKDKVGEKIVYSDIGFIALGDLLEQRFGKKLDELFKYENLHFDRSKQIDDLNCERLGRVAGHAGLFGTIGGIYDFVSSWPQLKYSYPGSKALGFDRQSLNGSTGGALSEQAVGHLGYTGTSLWIDPQTNSIYVLLMQRLDENGERSKEIMQFRRAFHQQAARLFSS